MDSTKEAMNRLQRSALLTELADRLRAKGCWCSETYLQKATYFLQELLQVPTGFEFIHYKFGPYSFDLGDELTALRADELVELCVRRPHYGPSLVPTATSKNFRAHYPVTLGKYADQLEFVADTLGPKGVAELERVATALYVTRKCASGATVEERARRLVELKPHVTLDLALAAVHELDQIARTAACHAVKE